MKSVPGLKHVCDVPKRGGRFLSAGVYWGKVYVACEKDTFVLHKGLLGYRLRSLSRRWWEFWK